MTRVFRWIGKLVLIVLTLFVTFVIAITILRPDDPTVEMLANSESAQREAYGRQMRELLYAGQYDSLEHVADRLRRERIRWDTGDWKLRTFYVLGFKLKESGSSEDQWVLLDGHVRRWIAASPRSPVQPSSAPRAGQHRSHHDQISSCALSPNIGRAAPSVSRRPWASAAEGPASVAAR